jgi:cell division protein FtsA
LAKEVVVGLDIGTTKVCAIVGEVMESGQVNIVGLGQRPSHGVRKGVIVDLDAAARAIREAVDDASRMTGYSIHTVVVGVTGQHIASLNSRGAVAITNVEREVTVADVERAHEQARVIVLPPDREIIHAIPRAYFLDGQEGISRPVGMSGTRLEVEAHIVTGAVTFLQNVAKSVHMAGLSVDSTVLEPIATGEAILTEQERDMGVAIADIGGGTTDVAIFSGGDVFYSAVIPVGGSHVTNDISVGLRAAEEESERVKLRYGAARLSDVGSPETDLFEVTNLSSSEPRRFSRRILAEIIHPRMEELFELVRHELEKSGYYNLLPAGLVLSGGGAQMVGARELCEHITGLPTRVGAPRDVVGLSEAIRSPVYATGVGLVLYGARQAHPVPATSAFSAATASSVVLAEPQRVVGGFMQSMQLFFARLMGKA